MKLRYLITGTGRCGTVHLAKLLTSLGIPCGHESIFDTDGLPKAQAILRGEQPPTLSAASCFDNTVKPANPLEPWVDLQKIVAEASYMAAPYLQDPLLQNTKIIHLLRHPVRVVNSFCNYLEYFWSSTPRHRWEQFIYGHFPELTAEMPAYERGCLYYLLWNEQIERRHPDLTIRLEDDVEKLLKFLGKGFVDRSTLFQDRKANSFERPSERFALALLQDEGIRQRLIDYGQRHGYQMSLGRLVL